MPSAIPAKMFPKNGQSDLDNYKLQVEILQQKLAKSEEQRQQLEDKFDKIQKKRNEYDKSIKTRSRAKFEEFLEKQRERNERNKKIIRMLEHIDQQAALLSQRSSRLKAMKRQYELYFARLLQSQALRIQNSPRYSYFPINQLGNSLMQPHELMPIYDQKGKPLGYTAINAQSPNHFGSVQSTNLYSANEDSAKPNTSIPLIATMPATPPGVIGNSIPGSRQQPSSSLMEMNNWNYLTPNNNYPISNIPNMNTNYMGNITSPRYPLNNYTNYPSQPNQFDFLRGQSALYNPNSMPASMLSQQNMMPEQWGLPSRSIPDSGRSYTETGMGNIPIKSDSGDMLGPATPQKSNLTNQRTFKDFDRTGTPSRIIEKKMSGEPHSLPSDYDFSKATEDDLNLLRELTTRNRLRTFNDSNENLSRNDSMQDLYPYGSRNVQEPDSRAGPGNDLRQRSPSRYSHSRSSSIENKTPNFRDPQSEENYMIPHSRNENERLPNESLITSFSNIHLANNDKSRDFDRSQSTGNNRISPSIDDRQGEMSTINRPTHVENKSSSSPSLSSETNKPYDQHQQPNSQNRGEFNSPTFSTMSSPEAVANSFGTPKDISLNNNRNIIPSNTNVNSSNIITNPNNNNNGKSSPLLLSPSSYSDNITNAAADKKQRPALLKKIQLPDYLSLKGNAEKNKPNNERTDADILKFHQPSGIDSSPLQFARKEKLTLENIENAMYGELINPEIPMSSVDGNDPVSQILRHHQTPAEIIAETNQGRKPTMGESFKPKLTGFKEESEPNDRMNEKLDINEKLLKNKIEIGNTKPNQLNIEKPIVDQSVVKQEINTAPPVEQIIPKIEKPPEPQGQEILEDSTTKTSIQENIQPIYQNDPSSLDNSEPDKQSTFDYDTPATATENQPTEIGNDYPADQEQYQTDANLVNPQQALDNQPYESSQNYSDPNNQDPNLYPTDQQQYDNIQDYQQYNEQNYAQDQQNTYENYPTDPNAYQTEYDPNAYNYNYDQQQQDDGTYAGYDPNQQYSEQDYNQQAYQQDPNYSDHQYAQQAYPDNQNITDQSDPNQYDYTQQQDIPTEGYEQQPASQDVALTENQSESIPDQQQPELGPVSAPAPSTPSTAAPATAKPKSVKPILTKEKSVDAEHKKKKRVNFVDSSDESSSAAKGQQQQPQLATTDESDFDFSSQ